MLISVLICTRNRAPDLRISLESLLTAANIATTDWELIVVDNSSTDQTAAVCQEYRERFPSHFRYIFEPQKGKSNALNTGIAAARGDVIAMTDDDVLLAPDYLGGIRTVFSQPSVDVVQGRVFLECPGGRPSWMDREMVYVLAGRDYGDQVLECKKDLVGVNLVVRARVFRAVGGFRTDLGPGSVGLCEDTEFTERVHQASLRVIYAPQIVIRHRISPDRLTKSAMRRYYLTLGRSLACYTQLPAPLWRFSLYMVKEFILREPTALWLRLIGHPDKALHAQCDLRLQVGMLLQHWRLKRQGKTPPSPSSSNPAG